MSDLLTDLDLAPERETVREPAKRWRNKWTTARGGVVIARSSGRRVRREAGEEWFSERTYPSKDIAETIGVEIDRINRALGGVVRHLGAFPVDENGEPL